ncbi:MAG: hypothetical protein MJ237_00235 [bacterium]|nr:hypothetical protein [bacterium]
MSDINGPKISVNQVNYNSKFNNQSIEPEQVPEENVQIKDFSDSKAEALGRSMLFKGADSTIEDLRAIVEEPQIVENSDKMFNLTYKLAEENGAENPYEIAATMSTEAKIKH